ncbi:MAG: methylated-DNA--[protein]-cysteine S-methyltransferase [Planctomycetota bacterium]
MPVIHYRITHTPFGEVFIAGDSRALTRVHFQQELDEIEPEEEWTEGGGITGEAERQLQEYFSGDRRSFDLPLAPSGTAFQRRVWAALRKVPYGETVGYGELAGRIGRPAAARAVGAANGRNPIPVIIPCHRVIGKDGTLVGFGGGLKLKRQLLDLESGNARH